MVASFFCHAAVFSLLRYARFSMRLTAFGLKRQDGNLSTYQVHDIFLVWGVDAPNPFRGIYPAPLCRPSRPGKTIPLRALLVRVLFYLLQLETLLYLESPSWKPRHDWKHQAGNRVMSGKIQPLKRLATPIMCLTAQGNAVGIG